MNNKTLITILSIVVIAGLAFIYGRQGMFESQENRNIDYGVEESDPLETTDGYGVSASHPLAVKVGMEVLENGGNAADAAVAVSYMLGVVEPFGSGLGGGGEMLVLSQDAEEPTVYQYREVAPQSGATPETFAIPGFVRGMETVNKELGSMDMRELIAPAIETAENGFPADKHLVNRLSKGSHRMQVDELLGLFPEGKLPEVNDELTQPELAETLRIIQEEGADAFYSGSIAKQILAHEPTLEEEDLSSYEDSVTEAVHGEFAGYDVYSAPPPLAGVTLIQSLQMAEALNIESTQDNQSDFIHLIGEISKRAYDDRVKHVGDPKFTDSESNEHLTSADYTNGLAETISLDELSENYEVNDSISDEEDHGNTTHFVIIDKEGTMVSATHTLGNFFGSGDNVGGFFLNNNMENFSTSNTSLNSVEPGKTPRSFTSPTIMTNGEKMIGIGTPGGKRIPMVMTEVLVRHLLFDESLEDAIRARRFYIEDNDIFTENELDSDVQSELRSRGYEIYQMNDVDFYGGIQALVLDGEADQIYGGADDRRSGFWQVEEK